MPPKEELLLLVEKHKYFILLALLGVFFICTGIFLTRGEFFSKPKIEILQGDALGTNTSKIMVEISGAVEKPGVYEFNSDARVDNLLVQAGGLSESADRAWVEKNINRAAVLKDGQKVYKPRKGETTVYGLQSTATDKNAVVSSQSTVSSLININTASLKELDSLEGIGAVRAQKIIDNRPYTTIDELVSKKILPKSVFEKIKEKINAP